MKAIFKKELRSFFLSMTGYALIAFLITFVGIYFMIYNIGYGYPYFAYTLSGVMLILLVLVPVITMRSFAEEKKNRTDQLPLDQSTVTNALDSYSDLSGTRKLKKADVDEAYGLDSPAYTIAMEDSEGNVTEINIGDMTGEEYYITADGGETVYTVASTITSYMVFDVNSLVQYETFPTIYETIFDKIVVTQGGATLLDYDAESEEESEEDSENDSGSSEDKSSDEESLTEIYAGEVGSIYFDDCVDYRADEDELAQYGLDESSRKEVTVTYEDTAEDETATVTFHMGDVTEEDDSTYVYIRLADSNMVYKVNADDMENLLAL